MTRVGPVLPTRKVAFTLMRDLKPSRTIDTRIDKLGRTCPMVITRGVRAIVSSHHVLPRVNSLINNNYCVNLLPDRLLTRTSVVQGKTINRLSVNCPVATRVHSAPGHSQKRELSPGSAGCYQSKNKLKYVKGASSVIQFPCVQSVTNAQNVASNPPVDFMSRVGHTNSKPCPLVCPQHPWSSL